jgi:glycosyltransferase involved in cell wall biosynthesis
MAKIVSVVLNSVSRDARVVKQARSLLAASHDVWVIGIADSNFTSSFEHTEDYGYLLRVSPKAATTLQIKAIKYFIIVVCLTSLVFLALSLGFPDAHLYIFLIFALSVIFALIFVRSSIRASLGDSVEGVPDSTERANRRTSKSFSSYLNTLVRVLLRTIGRIQRPLRILSMFLLVRRIRPDVVHCHDIHTLPIGILSKVVLRCAVIYDAHEIYEELTVSKFSIRLKYRLYHLLGQHFIDSFITINRSIAAWYSSRYPYMPAPVVIKNAAYVGVSVEYDGRLHSSAGIPLDRKVLLYQGGFSRNRGLDFLADSSPFLSDDWVIVFMGWGNYEAELRLKAVEINAVRKVSGRPDALVIIPPAPQRELALWTVGATLGIIPYENVCLNHWFCTPNKLWEYPAANVPVLVSPFPELTETVTKYGFGWVLPNLDSPKAFGEKVMSLTPTDIDTARQNCKLFMQDDNWKKYEGRLVELYDVLCSNRNNARSPDSGYT